MITIDYVILTHNSPDVVKCLDALVKYKDKQDRIIILDDSSTEENLAIYKRYPIQLVQHKLDKDYAAHRNSVLKHLKGNYTFWLDDDEVPHEHLLKQLKYIIDDTRFPDAIALPHRNVFKGVLPIHALKYNWTLWSPQGDYVNWLHGDYHIRIMKNGIGLKWEGELHEAIKLEDKHKLATLPKDERYAIWHYKTITEQLADNERYAANWSEELNKRGGSIE